MEIKPPLEEVLKKCEEGRCSLDELRTLAAEAGKQRYQAAIPALLQMLDHDDEIVRYHALMSLGFNLKYQPATDKFLLMLVNDKDEDVRSAAAGALAQLWEQTKEHHLIKVLAQAALGDADEGVRKESYRAMLIINGVTNEEHLHLLVQARISVDPERINDILGKLTS